MRLRINSAISVVGEINNFEIATSRKTLLAMTFRDFFSKLLENTFSNGVYKACDVLSLPSSTNLYTFLMFSVLFLTAN